MVALFSFVLPHLVKQCYNAQYTESEQAHYTKSNCPALAIVKALNQHHKANDGKDDGRNEIRKLHSLKFFEDGQSTYMPPFE